MYCYIKFFIPFCYFFSVCRLCSMEKEMATLSGILAWRIPWTKKPGGLQSVGSHRVRHDWIDWARMHGWSLKLLQRPGILSARALWFAPEAHWAMQHWGLFPQYFQREPVSCLTVTWALDTEWDSHGFMTNSGRYLESKLTRNWMILFT